jgi:hypothetical protein
MRIILVLALCCLAVGLMAAVLPAPLVKDPAAARAAVLKAGRCAAVDVEVDKPGILAGGMSEALPAGRYRLHVLLARAPLGDLFSNAVEVKITAGDATLIVNPLSFAVPGEFIDVPVTCNNAGTLSWQVAWTVPPKARKEKKATASEAGGPDDEDDLGDIADRPKIDADGTIAIADLGKIPYSLAVAGAYVERLCPVSVEVAADKVIYAPGDPGAVAVTLRNAGDTPAAASLAVEVASGLEGSAPAGTGTVTVPPHGIAIWKGAFATTGLRWGAEVRVTAALPDGSRDTGRAVIAVHDNPFAVSMLVAQADGAFAWKTPAEAEAKVKEWRDAGMTGCECFFWAPCDFGDFTPDTEDFYSGQTQYRHSISGTKNLVAALHANGMAATVYSNLWGTDGASGFEILRAHPEWFSPGAQVASDYLEFWRLMLEKKVTTPHQWCETWLQQNPAATEKAIDHHARELIASAKQFGWDAVRYDSYYSTAWTKWATRKTRDLVHAALPRYQFGYNTFPGADGTAGALDAMYDGGGMAMLEYIRMETYPKLADYLKELAFCRDIVWPSGGQIGPLYHPPTPPDAPATTATPIDAIYVSSVILAAGGHPYYHPLEHDLGRHPRFALRYAEYLWDNRLRRLKDPAAVVRFGNGAKPFAWETLAQTVTLDGTRRRLVLHLLNVPPGYALFANFAQQTPPPLRNLPVTLALPAGAQVSGAWNLCAVPDARHERLAVQAAGSAITLTVPEVRFWNVLVIDYTSPQPLPEAINPKTIWASCLQDWYVAGPFPNPGQCEGFTTAYPPERGVDLKATYTGLQDKPVAWTRTLKAGDPPQGPGTVDFSRFAVPGANGVAYAVTKIASDRERDVVLLAGSDDTLQIWLNGELKHANRAFRGINLDNDRVPVHLKAGENTLLVKVCDMGGGWGFILRVADADGQPVREGVRYGY